MSDISKSSDSDSESDSDSCSSNSNSNRLNTVNQDLMSEFNSTMFQSNIH